MSPHPRPWVLLSAGLGESCHPGPQPGLGPSKQYHFLGDISAFQLALFSENQMDEMLLLKPFHSPQDRIFLA